MSIYFQNCACCFFSVLPTRMLAHLKPLNRLLGFSGRPERIADAIHDSLMRFLRVYKALCVEHIRTGSPEIE